MLPYQTEYLQYGILYLFNEGITNQGLIFKIICKTNRQNVEFSYVFLDSTDFRSCPKRLEIAVMPDKEGSFFLKGAHFLCPVANPV